MAEAVTTTELRACFERLGLSLVARDSLAGEGFVKIAVFTQVDKDFLKASCKRIRDGGVAITAI
jgi:hypothetical protein